MAAYASQQVTYGRAWLNTILAALKTTAGGPLVDTAKIRLSNNAAYTPGPDDTIAGNAASEADYSGYAAGGIAVVLSAPVNLSQGCQGVLCPVLYEATAASPFVSAVVYGYWVDDGTNIICGERFAGAVNYGFAGPGDFLQLILQLPLLVNQLTQ
jgi:hypothetical protein